MTKTPASYLKALPPDRRRELARVRAVVRKRLPPGYREATSWGLITYEVPLRRYADTYNGQPLCYAGLGAQKNHLTLYLMTVYGDKRLAARLRAAFRQAGKRLDMGKACIRFTRADDLPLDAIGDLVAAVPVDRFIASAEAAKRRRA